MHPLPSSRYLIYALIGVSVLGGYAVYHFFSRTSPDALLQEAFTTVEDIWAYTQNVETTTTVGGRSIHVEGVYHINGRDAHFASISTTTLSIPENSLTPTPSFTLENIALGDRVYLRLNGDAPLRDDLPRGPEWHVYSRDAIPPALHDVVHAGPILDNMRLFAHQGTYLSPSGPGRADRLLNEDLMRYSFTLSRNAPTRAGGTLETMLSRIGDGSVTVWIEPHTKTIRHLYFENGDYRSTTSIRNINTPPSIFAPIDETPPNK